MTHTHDASDWERIIREMIARTAAPAPTEPGVYRMPCGNCYVDFFHGSDGTEWWLVLGDERSHTRDTVAPSGTAITSGSGRIPSAMPPPRSADVR